MPYYFACSDESYSIFTGIDAKENDLLAQWGWEQDILFHVGGMSGGHIYLRTQHIVNKKLFKQVKKLSDFHDLLNIPINVIQECLQLTKQYSSKGRKEKSVQIHITPWLNIKKYDGDNHGTIQFINISLVKTLKTATDKNMVDLLQETRTKKKMKVDDFRKQKDSKHQFNGYQWNNYHWKYLNAHCLFRYNRICPFWRHRSLHNMKYNFTQNLLHALLRRNLQKIHLCRI